MKTAIYTLLSGYTKESTCLINSFDILLLDFPNNYYCNIKNFKQMLYNFIKAFFQYFITFNNVDEQHLFIEDDEYITF